MQQLSAELVENGFRVAPRPGCAWGTGTGAFEGHRCATAAGCPFPAGERFKGLLPPQRGGHSALAPACAAMGHGPPPAHPELPCTAVLSLSLAPTVQGCSETQQTRVSGEGCSAPMPGSTGGSPGQLCRCCACFLMACAVCFSVCVVSPVKWKWSSESAQPLPAHADAGAATSPRHAPLGRLS